MKSPHTFRTTCPWGLVSDYDTDSEQEGPEEDYDSQEDASETEPGQEGPEEDYYSQEDTSDTESEQEWPEEDYDSQEDESDREPAHTSPTVNSGTLKNHEKSDPKNSGSPEEELNAKLTQSDSLDFTHPTSTGDSLVPFKGTFLKNPALPCFDMRSLKILENTLRLNVSQECLLQESLPFASWPQGVVLVTTNTNSRFAFYLPWKICIQLPTECDTIDQSFLAKIMLKVVLVNQRGGARSATLI